MAKKKNTSDRSLKSGLIKKTMQKYWLLFLGPTFAAFIIGFLWPFIQGIYLSLCKFTTTSNAKFIGFGNYIKAFADAGFRRSFGYTAMFAVVSLILINVIAFAVAYGLTRGIKGSNLFRGVFFLPNLIGGIVLGYIWNMIFNGILSRYGTAIVLNTSLGFWGLMLVMLWQQVGYMMIIYIAGLMAVPHDMIEAARIDGANGWQTLFHVTIPNMMPSITICTFLTLTNSFKLFDQNLVINNGQPIIMQAGQQIRTTEMLALNIYNTFYANSNSRGVGQAKAVLFFVLVAVISLIQLRATHSKEVQQ